MVSEKPVESAHWSGVLDQKESSLSIPRVSTVRSAALQSGALRKPFHSSWLNNTTLVRFTNPYLHAAMRDGLALRTLRLADMLTFFPVASSEDKPAVEL
jgi:hypothetical protein